MCCSTLLIKYNDITHGHWQIWQNDEFRFSVSPVKLTLHCDNTKTLLTDSFYFQRVWGIFSNIRQDLCSAADTRHNFLCRRISPPAAKDSKTVNNAQLKRKAGLPRLVLLRLSKSGKRTVSEGFVKKSADLDSVSDSRRRHYKLIYARKIFQTQQETYRSSFDIYDNSTKR